MKYRLNLDLGESSIGSGLIELDQNNMAKDISDAGVRIFEISEGAEERRLKKQHAKIWFVRVKGWNCWPKSFLKTICG